MVPERDDMRCEAVQGDLIRLVCGDVAEPSPALGSHLEACPACRVALRESRLLTDALRDALKPGPFSGQLVADLHRRLTERETARSPRIIPLLVPVAVAACLALAFLIPWRAEPTPGTAAPSPTVVAAVGGSGSWDSPGRYAVDAVGKDIEKAASALEKQRAANSVLPWGPEDDWDVPSDKQGTSGIHRLENHDETGIRVCVACGVPTAGGLVCRG